MIKTTNYNQHEIIKDIINLHCNGDQIDCDLTYSKGVFYKGDIELPRYKFDIDPQLPGVTKADSRYIPLLDNSIDTLIFDPPFVGGSRFWIARYGVTHGKEIEQDAHQAGQHPGDEQFADAGFRQETIDHQDHAGWNQDAKRAAGGNRGG